MKFTLKETSVDTEKSLCGRCGNGVVNRDSHGVVTRHCLVLRKRITTVIEACSSFEERHALDVYDMKQIAWILKVDRRSQQVGFAPPRDRGRPPKARLDEAGDLNYGDEGDE